MTQTKRTYVMKAVYPDGKVERYDSKSKVRFIRHTGTISWKNKPTVYLRVTYGMNIDNFGVNRIFYNDGDYTDKQDFMFALQAFIKET